MSRDPSKPAIVICSKSSWWPPIRREHAIARAAAASGHRVEFIELARHAKEGARDLGRWSRQLLAPERTRAEGTISVLSYSTFLPGHRGPVALRTDTALLRRAISLVDATSSIVVGSTPWQWPAIAGSSTARSVFDCTDDWGRLWGTRRNSFARLYEQIAREADRILVVSPELARLFHGRDVVVVPNATDSSLVDSRRETPESPRVMTYIGTLTERFDADLVSGVLERLPDWSLALYGECRYAGQGTGPSRDLSELLSRHPGRARWYGPKPREAIAPLMDKAAVLILPHRVDHASGQDSMKLYDYAARGKPIVSTRAPGIVASDCPGIHFADDDVEFARAVTAATLDSPSARESRRIWASANTWAVRWPVWRAAALGADHEGRGRQAANS